MKKGRKKVVSNCYFVSLPSYAIYHAIYRPEGRQTQVPFISCSCHIHSFCKPNSQTSFKTLAIDLLNIYFPTQRILSYFYVCT